MSATAALAPQILGTMQGIYKQQTQADQYSRDAAEKARAKKERDQARMREIQDQARRDKERSRADFARSQSERRADASAGGLGISGESLAGAAALFDLDQSRAETEAARVVEDISRGMAEDETRYADARDRARKSTAKNQTLAGMDLGRSLLALGTRARGLF